jgi:hypothetical protein
MSMAAGRSIFKSGLAVFAEAVMRLARNKVPLKRDVIFLSEGTRKEANTTPAGWPIQTGTKFRASTH